MRLYANQLEEAILAKMAQGKGYSRRDVAGLFAEEPVEAVGRALQRLAQRGVLASEGYRASTVYTYTRTTTKNKTKEKQ